VRPLSRPAGIAVGCKLDPNGDGEAGPMAWIAAIVAYFNFVNRLAEGLGVALERR
jgi:hypothetical protein